MRRRVAFGFIYSIPVCLSGAYFQPLVIFLSSSIILTNSSCTCQSPVVLSFHLSPRQLSQRSGSQYLIRAASRRLVLLGLFISVDAPLAPSVLGLACSRFIENPSIHLSPLFTFLAPTHTGLTCIGIAIMPFPDLAASNFNRSSIIPTTSINRWISFSICLISTSVWLT